MALVVEMRYPVRFTVGEVSFLVDVHRVGGKIKLWTNAPKDVRVERLTKDECDARPQRQ